MKQHKNLKSLSEQERKNKLAELQKELMQAKAQVATGTSLKNPGQIKVIKKNIARIYTLAHQKEETKKA